MGRTKYLALQGGLALLLVGSGAAPIAVNVLRAGAVHADGGTAIIGGTPVSGRVNQQVPISDLSIDGTGDNTLPVQLTADSGTLWLGDTDGLTFTGSETGSTLNFSGTRSDINAALATLHYVATSTGSDTLEVSLASSQQAFDSTTGHVYQYVAGNFTWQQAYDDAAASSYDGVPGYLATITSSDENDFIETRLSGNAWLGASDDSVILGTHSLGEGGWEWADGPEAYDNFCTGDRTCVPNDGSYVNWAGGEPNNSGGDENCMETYISDGTWNDLPCGNTNGYVIEYGSDGDTVSGVSTKDVSITTTAAEFAGGDGSADAPYQITDCERLQDLNQDLSAHYVLTHDIDCTDTPNWNSGQGFSPIGNDNDGPFTGTFDGAGYTIDGLTEIRADDDVSTNFGNDPADNQEYIGLFGKTDNATITNANLTSAMIKGYQYVGGLVGYMNGGSIADSSVNTNISQPDGDCTTHPYCVWARYGWYGGGLVGWMDGGQISDSQTGGPVKGSGHVIGGLVGDMEDGAKLTDSSSSSPADGGENIGGAVGEANSSTLQNVSTSGDILATLVDEDVKFGENAGGLIGSGGGDTVSHSQAGGSVHADSFSAGGLFGSLSSSNITDSYATGDVYSGDSGGGLIGTSSGNTVARVYASGAVDGSDDLGGLIGNTDSDQISDSFATGAVTSVDTVGALFGNDDDLDALSNVFFDATSTGQPDCSSLGGRRGCAAVTQSGYFTKKSNSPFTQDGSEVWLGSVWDFDGSHLPVFGTTSDDDDDGVSSTVENAAPNGGDANNDGTPDGQEANVTALVDPVSGHYTALAVNSACDLSNVSVQSEASLSSDNSYNYPLGLLNFTADCGTPGFSTTVTQYYYNPPGGDFVLRKFVNGSYQTISGATVSRQTIGGQPVLVVSYQVTDGGPLDADGTANGTIVDPAGPAEADGSTTLTDTGMNILYIAGIAAAIVAAALTVRYRTSQDIKG
ncbi:MAG TPA: choice-of-anchor U domain-containing protein [Candidatus Saccharimonadales bacterium]